MASASKNILLASAAALLASLPLTGALPAPQTPGVTYCNMNTVSTVNNYQGPALQTALQTTATVSCPGQGGDCSLTESNTYTIGKTVTIGGGLSLDPEKLAGNIGFDASVSWTTLHGKTAGAALTCPEGAWTCGVGITPYGYVVNGVQTTDPMNCGSSKPTSNPFTVILPQTQGGLPVVKLWVCSCPNELGWADNGAPAPCPQSCAV